MDALFVICAMHEIEDGSARGFVLARPGPSGGTQPWSILVSRKGRNVYGFENACPHQGLRLDRTAGEFMDDAGNFLTCSQHGAQFDLDTGHCFAGPCQGKALTQIRLIVDDGDVCVVGVDLADEDGLDLPDSDMPEVVITSD